MHFCRFCRLLSAVTVLSLCLMVWALLSSLAWAADEQPAPPEAPPVSEFAAVEPLLSQVDYHLGRIGDSLEDATRYSEAAQSRVAKDASILVVLFMALGMHDEETAVRPSAPRLVELAEALVEASADHGQAKTEYDALMAAIKEGASGGKPLTWEKRYQLGLLMKQVTTLHSRLKRYTARESDLARYKEDAAGYAAVLATIGQAALVDTHEVKDPSQLGDWYKYAADLRDAAGNMGKAIAMEDFAAITQEHTRLQDACDTCHEVFRILQ